MKQNPSAFVYHVRVCGTRFNCVRFAYVCPKWAKPTYPFERRKKQTNKHDAETAWREQPPWHGPGEKYIFIYVCILKITNARQSRLCVQCDVHHSVKMGIKVLTRSAWGVLGELVKIFPSQIARAHRLDSDDFSWLQRVEDVARCACLENGDKISN